MKLPSNDAIRNVLTAIAVAVSFCAFTLSACTFNYQYADHTATVLKTTEFVLQQKLSYNVSPEKVASDTVVDVSGGINLTIFNVGNRPISINKVVLYLQPGDYETLTHVDITPPCRSQPPAKILFGVGSKLIEEARVVDAQHILSIPIDFPMFSPSDLPQSTAQGTVCLKIESFSYNGRYSQLDYPVSLVRAVQGVYSPPSIGMYSPPHGADTNKLLTLF